MSFREDVILDEVVGDHVHAIVQLLQRASGSQQTLLLLQYAAALYVGQPQRLLSVPHGVQSDDLLKAHNTLQAALQTREPNVVRKVFWNRHFTGFAEALLSELGGDLVPALSESERAAHFDVWFKRAPADALLTALVTHLASVLTDHSLQQPRQPAASVSAIAANTAGAFLAERFALPRSTGVAELAAMPVGQKGGTTGSFSGHLAGLLASIPERAASAQIPALQPELFVPQLTRHILALLCTVDLCSSEDKASDTGNRGSEASTSKPSTSSGERTSSEALPAASAAGEAAFVGAVLGRLSRRGYSRLVARTLWASLAAPGASPGHTATFADALAAVRDASGGERLFEALLAEAGTSGMERAAVLQALRAAVLRGGLLQRPEVRYLLGEKLLMQSTLPPLALELLIDLLHSFSSEPAPISLQDLSLSLSQVWGDAESVQRLPPKRQAYLTAALVLCIQRLGREGLQPSTGLLAALLAGISVRLDQPIESLRLQGMRVGCTFATVLDPAKPLFQELGSLDMLPDELWHPDCGGTSFGIPSFPPATSLQATPQALHSEPPGPPDSRLLPKEAPEPLEVGSQSAAAAARDSRAAGQGTSKELLGLEEGGGPASPEGSQAATETDSDDNLEQYDLNEDDSEEFGMEGDKPLQLRDVAEMLRKSEDPQAVVRGLSLLAPLIEAAPEELANYSGELARALLHCRPPDWEDLQNRPEEQRPQVQRLRAMVSLVVEVPLAGGLALASEIYSPHLDLHQRLLILDSLSAAAQEMSTAPSRRKQERVALEAGQAGGEGGDRIAEMGKSRRWGARSLARLGAPRIKSFRNRFPEVANEWVGALLQEAGKDRHGVDLFGRDQLLLGRLLVTLGGFVEAATPSVQTVHLAAIVLELLRLPTVHAHPQPFVRRGALVAASQVLSGLPPARLAGAMTGGGHGDIQDVLLVERLEWLRGWLGSASHSDLDPQVKMLAAGCMSLQGSLAMKALECMETGEAISEGILPQQRVQLPARRAAQQKLDIKIPGIAEMRLS